MTANTTELNTEDTPSKADQTLQKQMFKDIAYVIFVHLYYHKIHFKVT